MSLTEFHDDLRSVASDVLAKDDSVDWPVIVDLGWAGLEAPEDAGGAGASFGEVAIILGEMGRAATRSAYLGGAVLSVGALTLLQPTGIRDQLLKDIASGAQRTTITLDSFTLENGRLSGRAEFVSDADGVDRLLVMANAAGVPVIVDVAADAGGIAITPQPVLDETRGLCVVGAEGVTIDESSVHRFDGDPAAQVRRLFDRASVAIACDSLGLSEAMLSATVSYARVRHQFGRPIGSFQAVKHACADMLVTISVARQLVGTAVKAVAENDPDPSVAASMAKSYACAKAVEIAGKAMQLHGGIGYTWESGIHVYLKRAALNRSIFGSPATHRAQLAQRYSRSN